jgi:hypothetical protein
MWARITLALLLALPTVPATAAGPIAEVVCAPRADMVARLSRDFRATPQGMGLRDVDAVMELWTDAEGRWTLVQRYATGISCILAMGEGWEPLAAGG